MSHSWIRISLGLLAAVLAGQAAEAEAQVVRLRRGAGLVVGAPFVGPVRIGIGPIVPRVVVGLPVRPALPLRRGLYLPPPAPAGVAA
ncbi:MAG TPA: hypothetical protein PKC18_14230, partial [Lacipirellulaceae bacterium]|nr:hypothetical protein [Lacipirellulaceae bacterium]